MAERPDMHPVRRMGVGCFITCRRHRTCFHLTAARRPGSESAEGGTGPHCRSSQQFIGLLSSVRQPVGRKGIERSAQEGGCHDGICLRGRLRSLCFSQSSFSLRTSTVSTKPTSMILCPWVTSAPASKACTVSHHETSTRSSLTVKQTHVPARRRASTSPLAPRERSRPSP